MQLVKRIDEPGVEQLHKATPGGLAGWLLAAFARLTAGGWRSGTAARQRELRLVETLSLGGRRQLMLVSCAGEQFLIGAGADSVDSVIRLSAEGQPREGMSAKKLADPWS